MSSGAELHDIVRADTVLHGMALDLELDWLEAALDVRFRAHFRKDDEPVEPLPSPPDLPAGSALAALHEAHGFDSVERLVLSLALAPHLRPAALDLFFVKNRNFDRAFAEFGGSRAQHHAGFLPSGETAAFLVAGEDLAARIALLELFDAHHAFARAGLLRLDPEVGGEPQLAGALQPSPETLQLLQTGVLHKPDYNAHFPAKRITTRLGWDDLVLAPEVMDEIDLLRTWLASGPQLLDDWGLGRAVKPGYRCLFYGPPGTGKTLTATLLGQSADMDVYRVDLSMVVSKYIGETEKNLARLFDQAQTRRWILFFDEADALFGQRTAANTSNDRHANQEVAYLLQRVEDYPGVVILASNLRGNIDEAFVRRFQAMVHFPLPDADLRLRLWRQLLDRPERWGDGIDLRELAERYEVSGGAMVNVLSYAVLQAHRDGVEHIRATHLRQGLARELHKEGRTA